MLNHQKSWILVCAADDEVTTLDPAQVEAGEGGETLSSVYDSTVNLDHLDLNLFLV